MAEYILPLIFLIIFGAAAIKDLPVYSYFTQGASKAAQLALSVFPNLAAIMMMMELLNKSGISAHIAALMTPLLSFVGIPSELSQLVFLRPFSGSGAIAVLSDILKEHGADSYIGRCAAAICGCTDTVLYMSVVYFSTTKIKKLRYAIPLSLLCNLVAIIIACQLCRVM